LVGARKKRFQHIIKNFFNNRSLFLFSLGLFLYFFLYIIVERDVNMDGLPDRVKLEELGLGWAAFII